ncbi:MAG: hypothetical protein AB7K36_31705 [Chloroflexota bacterium]
MHNEAHEQDKQGNERPAQEEGGDAYLDSCISAYQVGDDARDGQAENGGPQLCYALGTSQLHRLLLSLHIVAQEHPLARRIDTEPQTLRADALQTSTARLLSTAGPLRKGPLYMGPLLLSEALLL